MKVIDRVEIEYVIPETEAERQEIEALIAQVRADEKTRTFDPARLKKISKVGHPKPGTWRESQ